MTKIAILEDDDIISQTYRIKFEAEGFEVQVADNGKSGIALIQSFIPDLILLDLQMPIMTGEEVLSYIRTQPWGESVPVIILTNVAIDESPENLKDLGIHGYLVKSNMTPSQVVDSVKEALNL